MNNKFYWSVSQKWWCSTYQVIIHANFIHFLHQSGSRNMIKYFFDIYQKYYGNLLIFSYVVNLVDNSCNCVNSRLGFSSFRPQSVEFFLYLTRLWQFSATSFCKTYSRQCRKLTILYDFTNVRSLLFCFSIKILFASLHSWRWYWKRIACYIIEIIRAQFQVQINLKAWKLCIFSLDTCFTDWNNRALATFSWLTNRYADHCPSLYLLLGKTRALANA